MNKRDQDQLLRILGLNGLQATLAGLKEAAKTHGIICRNLKQPEGAASWDKAEAALAAAPHALELMDALDGVIQEATNTGAWVDAINGEDQLMLDAVNAGEAILAKIRGQEFTPHKPGDEL